jgi:hypothetical protein
MNNQRILILLYVCNQSAYTANEIQVFQSAFFLTHFIPLRNILIPVSNIYSRLLRFNVIINILLYNQCIIILLRNFTAVI